MADANAATIEPSIVNTPPPVEAPTPESKLFKDTPNGQPPAPPKAETPATPPSTPPAAEQPPTDATKPASEQPPATPPTEYVLKLPEGSLLSAEDLATIAKETKEAGLTKDEAEEVLKSHNNVATQTAARVKAQQETAFKEQVKTWRTSVEKDAELGGDKFNETIALSSRAFKSLASPALQQLADQTGLGSHPEFVRLMAKVGRMMAEDQLILGRVGGAPASRDPASVLYGKTTPDGTGRKSEGA